MVDFAVQTGAAQIPADVGRLIRLCALDWFACAMAGRAENVSRILRQTVLEEGGKPEALVIGGGRAPARAAALANGASAHALDYDDTHFLHIGHPSVVIFATALAMAERQGATGKEFLTAAAIGFETSVRIGAWLGRSHYQAGFHQTATAGGFGAAVTSGRLLKLDKAQMRHALGIAATRVSGLKNQFGSMGKPYNAGLAAAGGVEAALLAAHGLSSHANALDGPQGFGETHSGAANRDAMTNLGKNWLCPDVSYKFHACCHGTHAAVEAIALAMSDHPDAAQSLVNMRISVNPRWISVCNIAHPKTGLELKFSYRMIAALVLSGRDTAAPGSFSDSACSDPALTNLAEKITVIPDISIAETAAQVAVTHDTGAVTTTSFDLQQPIPAPQKQARLLAKAAVLLGERKANDVWAVIQNLAAAPDVSKFVRAFSD